MTQETSLIAPCGMNCGICLAQLRPDNRCPGCHGDDANKSKSCIRCIIRNCETIKSNDSGFCYECPRFPCRRLKELDKRYRTKYAMSMLENLEAIRTLGLLGFVGKEKERWRCPDCGGTICVHRGYCLECRAKRHQPQKS